MDPAGVLRLPLSAVLRAKSVIYGDVIAGRHGYGNAVLLVDLVEVG